MRLLFSSFSNFCSIFFAPSAALLPSGSHFPCRFYHGRDWRGALPASQQPPGGAVLHLLCAGSLDHSHLRTLCRKSVHATFLRTNPES